MEAVILIGLQAAGKSTFYPLGTVRKDRHQSRSLAKPWLLSGVGSSGDFDLPMKDDDGRFIAGLVCGGGVGNGSN